MSCAQLPPGPNGPALEAALLLSKPEVHVDDRAVATALSNVASDSANDDLLCRHLTLVFRRRSVGRTCPSRPGTLSAEGRAGSDRPACLSAAVRLPARRVCRARPGWQATLCLPVSTAAAERGSGSCPPRPWRPKPRFSFAGFFYRPLRRRGWRSSLGIAPVQRRLSNLRLLLCEP